MVVPARGMLFARAVALGGLWALAAAAVIAQVPSVPVSPGLRIPVAPAPTRVASRPASAVALEGAVDADAYVVGPGDGFTVTIGGSVPRQFEVTVSADGRLSIPESGSFMAAGRSLARVRAEALAALQRRYANVSTDVSLATPREFFVHVSGRISQPGRQLVPAIARVDAAVEAAGQPVYDLSNYREAVESEGTLWPALRNVRVESRGGRRQSVDLMRYLATGDLDANPYLADGDRVHVPSFDPVVEGVIVGGAVDRPGVYDVRPGDTARDLIEVASGLEIGARLARVRRVRAGAPVVEVSLADATSLDIAARDQLYAIPADEEAALARVEGAVRFPGSYPIVRGQTTIRELVLMAGGLREDALARATYLERSLRLQTSEGARASVEEASLPDVSVDADLLQGLFGRQFFARQTAATPRVSIDPEAALSGGQSIPLFEGDRLVVPFDDGAIRVYGRVARSGYVAFTEGATAGEYVERAGGTTTTAASVYVLDAATSQLSQGENVLVRRGDAVFVNSLPSPDTPEFANLALQERRDQREDARDRRQSRFQFIQTVLGVLGTVTSVVIAYVTLQSLSESN